MYVTTKDNRKILFQNNVGWKLLVKFRYGSEQWVTLKIFKETNQIEVSEFSTAREIADELTFLWWVPYTLRKRYRIIAYLTFCERKTS